MTKRRSFPSRGRRSKGEQSHAAGARPMTSDMQVGESRIRLPHERNESTEPRPSRPRTVMLLAKRDLDAGLVDTDLRNTPGLDAKQRAKLVGKGARRVRRGPVAEEASYDDEQSPPEGK